jgi:hypothetical protein
MSELPRELDHDTHDQVTKLCADGDDLARAGDFREAIARYNQAWMMIPEPRYEWRASTWVLAAIADASYLGGFGASALQALDYVMHCPDAIGNPFLHLRRGQVFYDDDQLDAAADELMRAYMGAGPEIFVSEDPKYLQFLGTRAKI